MFIGKIVKLLFPGKIRSLVEDTYTNKAFSIEIIKKYGPTHSDAEFKKDFCGSRISIMTDRKDFMTRKLENRDSQEVSDIQMVAHASDFVLANSETTSTALSCITFYPFPHFYTLRDPLTNKRLQAEIRSSFNFYREINAQLTA